MASRAFLHIGTMKSATTYLQQWGDVNRERLAEAGVLWPELGVPFAAADDLLGRTGSRRETAGAWAELDRQFRQQDGDAVFSNELLATLGPRKIARLVSAFAPAEVRVVVTARDLARVIPSQWQTTLKNGSTRSWSQFATAVCSESTEPSEEDQRDDASGADDPSAWFWRRQDLPLIVTKWREAVTADRVFLVTVPPAGSADEIVEHRFASVIGVDGAEFTQPAYLNSSLGAYSAELVRRVNAHTTELEPNYQRMGVRNALARLVLADRASSEPRCALSAEQLAWAQERARAMTVDLQVLGVRVVGTLDDLVPGPEVTPEGVDPALATEADLLEVAVIGLAGMARVHTDARLELSQLRRDHDALLVASEQLLGEAGRERD